MYVLNRKVIPIRPLVCVYICLCIVPFSTREYIPILLYPYKVSTYTFLLQKSVGALLYVYSTMSTIWDAFRFEAVSRIDTLTPWGYMDGTQTHKTAPRIS